MPDWTLLAKDAISGDKLAGRDFVRRYALKGELFCEDLNWFREAVDDVRNSIEPGLSLMISQIHVYGSLRLERQGTQNGFFMRAFARTPGTGKRPRRGTVFYGGHQEGTLFISVEGQHVPRIAYEEVAHCLGRLVDRGDPRCRTQLDEGYFAHLAHLEPMSQTVSRIWVPLLCHLEIYRGFLHRSAARRRSSSEDVSYVQTRAKMLEDKERCWVEHPAKARKCPC